jgi:hypothetical protein
MSLDVYLKIEGTEKTGEPRDAIFIRVDGQTKEITREEWNALYPDREPVIVKHYEDNCVFSQNITHNLGNMAEAAGIYKELWRPDELELKQASELILPLSQGLSLLVGEPKRFKKFNPENGWGTYEGLVNFVINYLYACTKYPQAQIEVSR